MGRGRSKINGSGAVATAQSNTNDILKTINDAIKNNADWNGANKIIKKILSDKNANIGTEIVLKENGKNVTYKKEKFKWGGNGWKGYSNDQYNGYTSKTQYFINFTLYENIKNGKSKLISVKIK